MSGKMIVLAGNVGAGKSTYTRILAEKMNFIPYYESVDDNPFLEDFYYDQKSWSYHLAITANKPLHFHDPDISFGVFGIHRFQT